MRSNALITSLSSAQPGADLKNHYFEVASPPHSVCSLFPIASLRHIDCHLPSLSVWCKVSFAAKKDFVSSIETVFHLQKFCAI